MQTSVKRRYEEKVPQGAHQSASLRGKQRGSMKEIVMVLFAIIIVCVFVGSFLSRTVTESNNVEEKKAKGHTLPALVLNGGQTVIDKRDGGDVSEKMAKRVEKESCIEWWENLSDRIPDWSKAAYKSRASHQLAAKMAEIYASNLPSPSPYSSQMQQELFKLLGESIANGTVRENELHLPRPPCVLVRKKLLNITKLRNAVVDNACVWEEEGNDCEELGGANAKAPRPFHDSNVNKIMLLRPDESLYRIYKYPYLYEEGPVREGVLDILSQLGLKEERVIHAIIARLLPGKVIPKHRDIGSWAYLAHRRHVVLSTHDEITFMIDGEHDVIPNMMDNPLEYLHDLEIEDGKRVRIPCQQEGIGFELNNRFHHQVLNKASDKARVHLIFDYIHEPHDVPEGFWHLQRGAVCGEGKSFAVRSWGECADLVRDSARGDWSSALPEFQLYKALAIAYSKSLLGVSKEMVEEEFNRLVDACAEVRITYATCSPKAEFVPVEKQTESFYSG